MRIAICDDELFYVQNIMERIKNYEFHDTKPTIIDGYTNGNELIDASRHPKTIVRIPIDKKLAKNDFMRLKVIDKSSIL